MKVRMLTSIAGVGFSLSRGDEFAFEDREAVRLVRAGYATALDDDAFSKAAEAFDAAEAEKAEAINADAAQNAIKDGVSEGLDAIDVEKVSDEAVAAIDAKLQTDADADADAEAPAKAEVATAKPAAATKSKTATKA